MQVIPVYSIVGLILRPRRELESLSWICQISLVFVTTILIFSLGVKLKLPPNYMCLVALRLMNVNVTAEVVQHFLAKCPFLEQLCLVCSATTLNLKIAGAESLKLKYLDLYCCRPMENLEISAPNLISFAYTGLKKMVPFKNVPHLCELCIGDEYCVRLLRC